MKYFTSLVRILKFPFLENKEEKLTQKKNLIKTF